jgi:hypothetical protein
MLHLETAMAARLVVPKKNWFLLCASVDFGPEGQNPGWEGASSSLLAPTKIYRAGQLSGKKHNHLKPTTPISKTNKKLAN